MGQWGGALAGYKVANIESGFDQSNATKRPTRMGSLYILYIHMYIYICINAKITVHKSPMNHELL